MGISIALPGFLMIPLITGWYSRPLVSGGGLRLLRDFVDGVVILSVSLAGIWSVSLVYDIVHAPSQYLHSLRASMTALRILAPASNLTLPDMTLSLLLPIAAWILAALVVAQLRRSYRMHLAKGEWRSSFVSVDTERCAYAGEVIKIRPTLTGELACRVQKKYRGRAGQYREEPGPSTWESERSLHVWENEEVFRNQNEIELSKYGGPRALGAVATLMEKDEKVDEIRLYPDDVTGPAMLARAQIRELCPKASLRIELIVEWRKERLVPTRVNVVEEWQLPATLSPGLGAWPSLAEEAAC